MARSPLFFAHLMTDNEKTSMYAEITEWDNVAKELATLVEREKELRTALFMKYFATNSNLEEGTNHISLEYGKQLTADYRINRSVDEAQLDAAIQLGHISRQLVDGLFNFKPSLRVGEWRNTSPETKLLFGEIITESPGLPGLKITSPKR